MTPPLDACDVESIDRAKVRRVRRLLVNAPRAAALAATFKALADPTRLKVIHALASEELCVCDLANAVGIRVSSASHHLRLLRDRNLVRSRREGRMVFYALDDGHVRGLIRDGLEHMGHVRHG